MEPVSKRARIREATAQVANGGAVFDVGGRVFKILRHIVEARPLTLLASLLDDIDTDASQPIYVDANPDRFGYILDWYRYGEMFVPTQGFPIEAVLRDARFFLLPDSVKINSVSYSIQPPLAEEVQNEAINSTMCGWPNFGRFLQETISDIKAHFANLGAVAAHVQTQSNRPSFLNPITYPRGHVDAGVCKKRDLPRLVFRPKEFRFSIQESRNCDRWFRWLDPENVGSKGRLYVLVHELEKRGFSCSIKESFHELVLQVGLPFDVFPDRQRVQIAGVDTGNGALPVSQVHSG